MKNFLLLLLVLASTSLTNLKAEVTLDGSDDSFEVVLDQGVASFCRDRLSILRLALRRATLEASRGNAGISAQVLIDGLKRSASQISPRYANTLTSKAIIRGVGIANSLMNSTGDRAKVRTVNYFLNRYYRFIEETSNNLDVPFYQTGRCGFCNSRANEEFEQNFVTFASEQLNMVLDSMTTDHGGIIYPVGSPRVLLSALKSTTALMANDLSEALGATRYACVIRELADISNEAGSYLKGGSFLSDDFDAIQELVSRSREASDQMNGYGCR